MCPIKHERPSQESEFQRPRAESTAAHRTEPCRSRSPGRRNRRRRGGILGSAPGCGRSQSRATAARCHTSCLSKAAPASVAATTAARSAGPRLRGGPGTHELEVPVRVGRVLQRLAHVSVPRVAVHGVAINLWAGSQSSVCLASAGEARRGRSETHPDRGARRGGGCHLDLLEQHLLVIHRLVLRPAVGRPRAFAVAPVCHAAAQLRALVGKKAAGGRRQQR